jgi:hypothetical protein
MSIKERFRNFIWGEPLEDLVIDLKMYSKDIARTRDMYKQRSETLWESSKERLVKGDEARAKMFLQQYQKSDSAAVSLDMFVITMENLVFDLGFVTSVEDMGKVLGKVSKTLGKLNLLQVRGSTRVMDRVNRQMGKIGLNTKRIFDSLKDYEPFNVEEAPPKSLDKLMDKLVSEVIAEGPAMGLTDAKVAELQKKRESLKSGGLEDKK